jgi:hypothetical protein
LNRSYNIFHTYNNTNLMVHNKSVFINNNHININNFLMTSTSATMPKIEEILIRN